MRIRPARNRRTIEKVMVAVEADVMVCVEGREAGPNPHRDSQGTCGT